RAPCRGPPRRTRRARRRPPRRQRRQRGVSSSWLHPPGGPARARLRTGHVLTDGAGVSFGKPFGRLVRGAGLIVLSESGHPAGAGSVFRRRGGRAWPSQDPTHGGLELGE